MMRVFVAGLIVTWGVLSVAGTAQQAPAGTETAAAAQDTPAARNGTVIREYCVTCHNERTKTAGLTLDTLDLTRIPQDAEVWEKVVRRLRASAMPPAGVRRPDEATYAALTTYLEGELDRAAAAAKNPGRPLLHRLNRAEVYANAIRDLLALDVDASTLLPPDDSGHGFDNVADVLGVSPALQERYLAAADKISALAVGDPEITPGADTYRIRQDLSQNQHIEGMPLGTVGGARIRHNTPLDAEYVLQVRLNRTNTGAVRGLEYPHQLEITVDGNRVHLAGVGGTADLAAAFDNPTLAGDDLDARLQVRVRLEAGPREIGIAFLQRASVQETRRLQPFLRSADTIDVTGRPHIDSLTVSGPFDPTGPGDTPSRRKIFSCYPKTRAEEQTCGTRIVSTLARLAYRGTATPADVQRLQAFFEDGRAAGGFERGVELALRRILASPKFAFRVERSPADVKPGTAHALNDVELASRLSFFLWSSIPDEPLLTVASQNRLRNPAVLAREVQRMLADPRSSALVSNFAGQWLYLRNLKGMVPNSGDFPDFDDNLRRSFQTETELFFASIMREDRSVLDLLQADYTFVDERLARHYGMPNIYGSHFRRVPVANEARRGLLGQGSVLTVTSHVDRTSPVVRGKWILENLMGIAPPPPPANVPPLAEPTGVPQTMRERMEQHRANPVCANCHKMMDPIGLAMENFDAVGMWRARDSGVPIDATAQLLDGTAVNGVVELRQALLKRPEVFVGTMVEKLMTYGLGRGLNASDMPVVRAILRDAAGQDYRFSALVRGIVTSVPFQMRIKPEDDSRIAARPGRN